MPWGGARRRWGCSRVAWEIRERVLGPEHPDTLGSRGNLAISYRTLGRAQEALKLDVVTLELMARVLGPEHPHTLGSRNNLASATGP